MGNQMFQYAFARSIQLKLGVPLRLDISVLMDPKPPAGYIKRAYDLNLFELSAEFHLKPEYLKLLYAPNRYRWSQWVRKLAQKGYKIHQEEAFSVNEALLSNPFDNVIYQGYWQSERYFEDIRSDIKADFSFRSPVLPQSSELASQITSQEAVCLNIRRTDLLQSPTHNVTDIAYFDRCLEEMKTQRPESHIYLFSDDLDWSKKTFGDDKSITIVGHEHAGPQFGNYLQLMQLCTHFIIPNSTFAWWAAWLGEQEESIILAPERWFGTDKYDYKDVVPKRWTKMPNPG